MDVPEQALCGLGDHHFAGSPAGADVNLHLLLHSLGDDGRADGSADSDE